MPYGISPKIIREMPARVKEDLLSALAAGLRVTEEAIFSNDDSEVVILDVLSTLMAIAEEEFRVVGQKDSAERLLDAIMQKQKRQTGKELFETVVDTLMESRKTILFSDLLPGRPFVTSETWESGVQNWTKGIFLRTVTYRGDSPACIDCGSQGINALNIVLGLPAHFCAAQVVVVPTLSEVRRLDCFQPGDILVHGSYIMDAQHKLHRDLPSPDDTEGWSGLRPYLYCLVQGGIKAWAAEGGGVWGRAQMEPWRPFIRVAWSKLPEPGLLYRRR